MIQDIVLIVVTMLLLDGIFLSLMRSYFENQIKAVQKSPLVMNPVGAILCYIALVFGLYYFIIREKKGIFDAFLLGLIIYAVYETTTLALLSNWRPLTVLVDTTWGGILFALTTFIVYKVKGFLNKPK